MRNAITVAAAAAVLTAAPASAATQDTQVWTVLGVSGQLAPGILGAFEATERFTDDVSRLNQVELRAQVGTPLSKSVTVFLGYVHLTTYNPTGSNGIEHQAVEQINWKIGKIGRATLSARARLEQRFQRGVDSVAWRTREQVRLVVRIKPRGPSAVLWVEPFVSLNRTSAVRPGIDQVRSFAGVSVPISKAADVEAGYLNQYLNRPSGDRSNHALSVSLAYRF